MRTIAEAATELRQLKELHSQQEEAAKATKTKIERIEKIELPELLEAAGVDNSRVPGVGTVYLNDKVFAHVRKESEEVFFDFLRKNGHADIIKEGVHPGTLNSWAKEQFEKGEPLPDFVNVSFVTQAALRKA